MRVAQQRAACDVFRKSLWCLSVCLPAYLPTSDVRTHPPLLPPRQHFFLFFWTSYPFSCVCARTFYCHAGHTHTRAHTHTLSRRKRKSYLGPDRKQMLYSSRRTYSLLSCAGSISTLTVFQQQKIKNGLECLPVCTHAETSTS